MANRITYILIAILLTANIAFGQNATPSFYKYFGAKTVHVGDNSRIVFSGVDKSTIYYHPVTGAGLEESIALYKDRPSSVWKIGGKIGYAFKADRLTAGLDAQLSTNNNHLRISVGRDFADWKGNIGEERFNNSVIALFTKKNYKALNWRKHIDLEYGIKPTLGLEIKAGMTAEQIESEHNRCGFSIFKQKRKFRANEPFNILIEPSMTWDYDQMTLWLEATYTPRTIGFCDENGHRYELGSLWPTFSIRIEQGVGKTHSEFTHVNINTSQRLSLSNDAMFKWEVEGGKFLGDDLIGFGQWKHFRGSNKRFALSNELDGYIGFVMFRPYELSTNRWHTSAKAAYITPKLLLKQIRAIGLLPFKEELYLKSALINGDTSYTEIGYGLGNVMDVLRTTIFTSFINTSFESVRFRMAIDL